MLASSLAWQHHVSTPEFFGRTTTGDEPILYALTREGDLLRRITLPDSPAHDWEDLAIGPGPEPGRDYLYIADTGDNDLERRRVQVIRVLEPDPNGFAPPAPVEVFELEYGDGDPHDGEAMFVDPTDAHVYIVTKRTDHDDRKSKLFTSGGPLPAGGGNVRLEKLAGEKKAPHLDGVWVAADVSPGGDQIVLVPKKDDNLLFERRVGESVLDALSATPCAAPRPKGHQEAIAFSGVGAGYYMVPEGTRPTLTFAAETIECPEFEIARAVTVESPSSVELSGVVVSPTQPNVLWAVNDPGREARNHVVALSRDGIELGTVELARSVNIDWEDIAAGPGPTPGRTFLYVADIGDNDAKRDFVTVHRFEEPRLSALPSSALPTPIDFVCADGESRDAESVFVD